MPHEATLEMPAPQMVRIDTPNALALKLEAQELLTGARAIVVDSDSMFEVAAEELRAIKAKQKRLDEQRKSITKPLDDAKAAVMALFRLPVEFCENAERAIKAEMARWIEHKAAETKKANDEATRLAREEQDRLDRAARQAQEEARQAAAEAAAATDSAEAQAAQERAVAAEAAAAAMQMQSQMPMSVAPVEVARPKAAGVSSTKRYGGEITDKEKLLQYIVANPAEIDILIEFRQGAIDKRAAALKEAFNLPGVRLTCTTGISARA